MLQLNFCSHLVEEPTPSAEQRGCPSVRPARRRHAPKRNQRSRLFVGCRGAAGKCHGRTQPWHGLPLPARSSKRFAHNSFSARFQKASLKDSRLPEGAASHPRCSRNMPGGE